AGRTHEFPRPEPPGPGPRAPDARRPGARGKAARLRRDLQPAALVAQRTALPARRLPLGDAGRRGAAGPPRRRGCRVGPGRRLVGDRAPGAPRRPGRDVAPARAPAPEEAF